MRSRLKKEQRAASTINTWAKRTLSKIDLQRNKEGAATLIASKVRQFLTQNHFKHSTKGPTKIQVLARGYLARKRLKQARYNAAKIQRAFRYHNDSAHFSKVKSAIPLLQKVVRGGLGRRYCKKRTVATNTISRAFRRYCEKRDEHKSATNIARIYRGHASRVLKTSMNNDINEQLRLLSISLAEPFKREVYLEAIKSKELTLSQKKLMLTFLRAKIPFLPQLILTFNHSKLGIIPLVEKGLLTEPELHRFASNRTRFPPEDFEKVSDFIKDKLATTAYRPNMDDILSARALGDRYLELEQVVRQNFYLMKTFITPPTPTSIYYKEIKGKLTPAYPQLYAWKSRIANTMEAFIDQVDKTIELKTHGQPADQNFDFTALKRFVLLDQLFKPDTQESLILHARQEIFEGDLKADGKLAEVVDLLTTQLQKVKSFKGVLDQWRTAFGDNLGKDPLSTSVLKIINRGLPYHSILLNFMLNWNNRVDVKKAEEADNFMQKTVDEAIQARFLSPWERFDPVTDALLSFSDEERRKIEIAINKKETADISSTLIDRIKQHPPRPVIGLYQPVTEGIHSAALFEDVLETVSIPAFDSQKSAWLTLSTNDAFSSVCEYFDEFGKKFKRIGEVGKVETPQAQV